MKWTLIGVAGLYACATVLGAASLLLAVWAYKTHRYYQVNVVNDTATTVMLYRRCTDPVDITDILPAFGSHASLCHIVTFEGEDSYPPLVAHPGETVDAGGIDLPGKGRERLYAFVLPSPQTLLGCIVTRLAKQHELTLRVSAAVPCSAVSSKTLAVSD